MDAAKKYQFAEAFDGGQGKREDAVLADAQTQWEATAQAREAAAFEKGKAEALASLEAETLAQVQTMNAQLLELAAQRGALQDTMARASVELAHLSALKIADVLIERGPGRLVAETVLHALPLVIGEARIVVRLAEPLVDHIKSRMDDMAMEAGFVGKVVLLGDERIAPGDCRIEWANGGIERRADAIKDDIATAIRACLSEYDGAAARQDNQPPAGQAYADTQTQVPDQPPAPQIDTQTRNPQDAKMSDPT